MNYFHFYLQNVVNNDEPPEYLKESIEKSNRATDNSQDSVNMKDFLQEPTGMVLDCLTF